MVFVDQSVPSRPHVVMHRDGAEEDERPRRGRVEQPDRPRDVRLQVAIEVRIAGERGPVHAVVDETIGTIKQVRPDGVVGVIKGCMKFMNYCQQPENGKALSVMETIIGPAGTVTTVYPPTCDIHRMGNGSDDEIALTLHCYGQEVTQFHIYNLETGERRVASISYDSKPVIT